MYAKYQCETRTLTKDCQHNKNVVIAGDFNYKNIDWENQFATNGHRHLADFIDTLQECFLFQCVTDQTRQHELEASNILDLVLSSEEGTVKDLPYHPHLWTERSYLYTITK